ncbi:MAG: ATP-binding protein, partial [bacterium]|nr:ATP-binding protein [bacterium]
MFYGIAMKFMGRDNELKQLIKFETLSSSGATMIGIIGRRRVGKTTLVKEFITRSERNSIYLFVDEKREELLLAEFTEILKTAFNTTLPGFRDWDTFFSYLMELEDVNIIFDEFQNFAAVNNSVFSIFQKHYDAHPDAHILFLLVGSYMGMMKKILGEARSPLFGRTASIWKIRPFTLKELTPTLPDKPEEAIPIYLLYGGIPHYYELMGRFNCTNIKDSLRELLYWDGAPLLYEPQMLLSQEFMGKWRTMFSILEAISTGKCSHKEISDYTGIPQTNLSKYLEELAEDYEIISKEFPVTEDHKRTKMGRYRIREHFISFWFRFIYKNRTMVEKGDWQSLSSIVEKEIDSH